MKRPFTMVVLSEWMEDDVDHSELIVNWVDDVIVGNVTPGYP